MELYHRNILMKKLPGIPRSPQSPLGPSGTPWARHWAAMGTSLEPRARPPLGPSGETPGIPGGPEDLHDHTNSKISTNLQRQKRSVAASAFLRCIASPRGLPWTGLLCILREQSPFWPPGKGIAHCIYPNAVALVPCLYVYIYIMLLI